jgi:hypothetical protein
MTTTWALKLKESGEVLFVFFRMFEHLSDAAPLCIVSPPTTMNLKFKFHISFVEIYRENKTFEYIGLLE